MSFPLADFSRIVTEDHIRSTASANSALGQARAPARLSRPAAVSGLRPRWAYAISIVLIHLLALLAFWPALFSWTGMVLCVLGLYVFGTLGINLGFHRLLTHRSFTCPRWVERVVAILGVCCLQEGPARWVAIHRKHHQQSDEQPDPHSPLVAFFWGHVGWLLVENRETDSYHVLHRYARDLVSQPFYLALERRLNWFWIYLLHIAGFAVVGLAIGLVFFRPADGPAPGWLGLNWFEAGRFALSVVLWGVFVRTVLVWHITWSVNSLSHLFGYRTHLDTGENSRNNWFVALISNGEGWHNNHHADQCSAAHGHRWFEVDVTYWSILLLERLGLARDVKRPGRSAGASPAGKG